MGRLERLRRDPDRGVSAIEVVFLTPVIIMMVLLIVGLGVLVNDKAAVSGAARDAARSGSMQPRKTAADAWARATASADLRALCTVAVQYTAVYTPPTTPNGVGYYAATVTCTVNMAPFDLFSSSKTVSETFTAPVDPYQNSHLDQP